MGPTPQQTRPPPDGLAPLAWAQGKAALSQPHRASGRAGSAWGLCAGATWQLGPRGRGVGVPAWVWSLRRALARVRQEDPGTCQSPSGLLQPRDRTSREGSRGCWGSAGWTGPRLWVGLVSVHAFPGAPGPGEEVGDVWGSQEALAAHLSFSSGDVWGGMGGLPSQKPLGDPFTFSLGVSQFREARAHLAWW